MSDPLLERRVSRVETDVADLRSSLKSIIEIAPLEERRIEERRIEMRDRLHSVFNEVVEMNKRLREIEVNMPTLKLTSSWILSALVMLAVGFGAAVAAMVIK